MSPSSPAALVSLKSFGDFIIARWALRQLEGSEGSVSLIAGRHLSELDAALGAHDRTLWIGHGEDSVPALFDLHRRGLRRGLLTAWRLRKAIGELGLSSETTLVFDKVGAREAFIAGRSPVAALPAADNIYLAYEKRLALKTRTCPEPRERMDQSASLRTAGIFPGSRLAAKILPADLVSALGRTCTSHGFSPHVFVLEGEETALPSGLPDVRMVPRRFDEMVRAVRSVDVVVSADSMPAHMAEYFGVPIFVVSPAPNKYWLPLSCFATGRWTLFDEAGASASLARHLLELNEPSPRSKANQPSMHQG